MEEEKVQSEKTKLEILTQELELLKSELKKVQRGEVPTYDESVANERFVNIRVIDDMPIIRWDERMKNKQNDKGVWVDFIKVYSLDGKKENELELEYLEFIRNIDKVKAKIVDEKVTIQTIIQGTTTKKFVKDGTYRTIDTGIRVPVKVQIPESMLTVEMPNGDRIEINSKYVN